MFSDELTERIYMDERLKRKCMLYKKPLERLIILFKKPKAVKSRISDLSGFLAF